jgi:hypothetical protein
MRMWPSDTCLRSSIRTTTRLPSSARYIWKREAKEKADQAAREKAEQNGKPKDGAQRMRWSRAEAGVAEASKGNLTDPESGLVIDGANKAFVQGYNAQVVAAGVPQIIVTDGSFRSH